MANYFHRQLGYYADAHRDRVNSIMHMIGNPILFVAVVLPLSLLPVSVLGVKISAAPLLTIPALVLWTAWDIVRESLNILLEGLPKGLKLSEVTGELCHVSGVIDVHDLHIWSLGSEAHALSCHVLIEDMPPSASDSILKRINDVLCDRFAINHTTIQFEHTRCALAEASCTIVKQHQH